MSYAILWRPRALKDLRKLDVQTEQRIVAAVELLASEGRGDIRKLVDVTPPEYRLRVGQWRVLIRRDEPQRSLVILRVRSRDKAYE